MQIKLADIHGQIAIFHEQADQVFQHIASQYRIKSIFSHQEIGNKVSYDRDLRIKQFCSDQSIEWNEYQHNGVVRKLKSRKEWEKLWKQKMEESPKLIAENPWNFLVLDSAYYQTIKGPELNTEITTNNNQLL